MKSRLRTISVAIVAGILSALAITGLTQVPIYNYAPPGVAANLSGLGAGVATFLATPSSANLASALTDESGTAGTVPFHSTGPWTATDGSGAGLTLTTTDTNYVRIGSMVYAYFSVTYPATADGSSMTIGGLPFPAVDGTNNVQPVAITFQNSTVDFHCRVTRGAQIILCSNISGAAVTNANMSGKILRGTAIYQAQ